MYDQAAVITRATTYGISCTLAVGDLFGFVDKHVWVPALALGILTFLTDLLFKTLRFIVYVKNNWRNK
jgi:hypothetical protein